MKSYILKNHLPVLMAILASMTAVRVTAQTFKTLYSFTDLSNSTNIDGAGPTSLILAGNTLYGTTQFGGTLGHGTVFKINTDGTGFAVLSNEGAPFAAGASWIVSGNTVYGFSQPDSGLGTVFAIGPDSTNLTILHEFSVLSSSITNSDGARPTSLILSGNTLYGTTQVGGAFTRGTIFSLTLPSPQLSIIPSHTNVILTWPTNATGFTLQSTTNLIVPAAWTTNSPAPVVVNGQNTVTNSVSGTHQFFRLSQ